MEDWTVRRLDAECLADAYPLVRSATRVSQQRWETFGEALIAGGGGILAVGAPDGCVHGAAAFRRSIDLRHEQALDVMLFAAFALGGDDPVRARLYAALEEVAANEGCKTISVTMDARSCGDPNSACRAAVERFGLSVDTVGFVRAVTTPGDSGEKVDRQGHANDGHHQPD